MKYDVVILELSVELFFNVKGKLIDEILEFLRRVEEKFNVILFRGLCFLLMYSIKL